MWSIIYIASKKEAGIHFGKKKKEVQERKYNHSTPSGSVVNSIYKSLIM